MVLLIPKQPENLKDVVLKVVPENLNGIAKQFLIFINAGKAKFNQGGFMNELINVAVVIAILFGGTMAAEKIFVEVRKAALTKAAHGLPRMTPFAKSLTRKH